MTAEDSNSHGSRFDRAIAVFKNHCGILRTALALRSGIHPGTLYTMRDFGVLEMVIALPTARRWAIPTW